MFVIAGATGKTGGAAADALLAQGQPVTVLVRSTGKGAPWQAKGAAVAIADLERGGPELTAVLRDAAGAYVLLPPNQDTETFLADRRRTADSIGNAVHASGIRHVVALSSIGAHLDSGTGPIAAVHHLESVLGQAAANATFLRAAYFIENWAPMLGAARGLGSLPTFLKADRKIPMIATRDIGAFAADCLLNPPAGHRVVEIAGPVDYSPADIAGSAGEALGWPVKAKESPVEGMAQTMTMFGYTNDVARLFQEMTDGLNRGHIIFEGTEIRRGAVTAREVIAGLV